MVRATGIQIIGIYGLAASLVLAAIPEPDTVLYGPALMDGAEVHQGSPVLLTAQLADGQEIGRFDFGDCNADGVRDVCEFSCEAAGCSGVPGCGTARDTNPADGLLDDCPGNLYALKVRCESVPDGLTPSGNAAMLNPTEPEVVDIYMAVADGPEKFVRSFVIDERGKIYNIALSILNLFAYRDFQRCQAGPGAASPSAGCPVESFSAADYNEDGGVDLRDFAFIQNHFVGN